jgi:hypothetical protein
MQFHRRGQFAETTSETCWRNIQEEENIRIPYHLMQPTLAQWKSEVKILFLLSQNANLYIYGFLLLFVSIY